MPRLRALALLLLVAFATGALAYQDKDKDAKDKDKKEEKKDKEKLKGFLPANYKKLGLSEAQVQKIYKLQAEYKDKLAAIERQKSQLKAEEKEAIEKVLTKEQLAELDKIRTGKKDKEKDK